MLSSGRFAFFSLKTLLTKKQNGLKTKQFYEVFKQEIFS